MTPEIEISINVEPVKGGFDVVARKDGTPWLRHGPYDDLDVANMVCCEMLKRARALRERVIAQYNREQQE